MEIRLSYPLQESTRLLFLRTARDVARTVDELTMDNPTDAHLAALESLQSLGIMFENILLANDIALDVVFHAAPDSVSNPRPTARSVSICEISHAKKT